MFCCLWSSHKVWPVISMQYVAPARSVLNAPKTIQSFVSPITTDKSSSILKAVLLLQKEANLFNLSCLYMNDRRILLFSARFCRKGEDSKVMRTFGVWLLFQQLLENRKPLVLNPKYFAVLNFSMLSCCLSNNLHTYFLLSVHCTICSDT